MLPDSLNAGNAGFVDQDLSKWALYLFPVFLTGLYSGAGETEYNGSTETRTLDVHAGWLRQKLEDNPKSPAHILTVRGFGYKFNG